MTHTPLERNHRISGFSVDCSCGYRDVIWSTTTGARTGYLEHVSEQIVADAEWPGTVRYVEYDENDD